MRAPAVVATIALGALSPSLIWAAATIAETAKAGPTAAHPNPVKSSPVGHRLPKSGSHSVATKPPTAVGSGGGQSQALQPRNRTAPSRGRFIPYSSKANAAAGLSGNDLRRHVPAAPMLGGPAKYDAKKGAVL
jgi:hypothetical protein